MSVNGIQQTVRARAVVKGSGPKVTLSFNDDQLCVTVSNRVIGPDVPVTFFQRLRVCRRIPRVGRLWVLTRRGWRLSRIFTFSRRCFWVMISGFRGRLSPTVTQEGPVRVCNITKAANSSILLPTPTSQIAQSISTAQMVSSSGASILVTSVLGSQSSPLRISPASVSSTSASISATPVLTLQSSSLRISPASTAPTSATVSSPVASMS